MEKTNSSLKRLAEFLAITIGLLLLAMSIILIRHNFYKDAYEKYEKLFHAESIIRSQFIGEIDESLLMDMLMTGLIYGTNDKYGRYYGAEDFAAYLENGSDTRIGLGINIAWLEGDQIKITDVLPGSPAEACGLRTGDLLYSVGGVSVSELGYNEALSRMRGEEGKEVVFSVLRDGEELLFNATLKAFKTYSVIHSMLDGDIGYINISQFKSDSTYDEFYQAYSELSQSGAKSFVFDVRYNPGGDLYSVCNILDLLLPEGPIVWIEDRDGRKYSIDSDDTKLLLPAVVLINEESYSGAELFASAIRDYGIATLVGKTTYGKGTMQYVYPFEDGSGMVVSTRLYSPPSGVNYEGIGVAPHVEVDIPEDIYKEYGEYGIPPAEFDTQLQSAISLLDRVS